MAQMTLSKYLQYINELIDESRLAEAVAHSRHLLEQHPRHIDTYRSLAKALLEQGDYAGAVDLFQRVLSAAPADFIAHVGLAVVHKAGDRWKQALWHMERAFEVEPYNAAIRTELQDLYGRRDGLAPAQIELTRGALARLYVRGGLYQQAVLELRELLEADPERVDLKLLLAEAHWRADERVEAAARCEEILELLPDCIDAHAMLADIMLATGDAGSAIPHLERLQALTQLSQNTLADNASLAPLFKLPGAPALPREIRVDYLSDGEALGLGRQAEAAAWIGELDLEAETVEDDLGWLQELEEEGAHAEPPAPAEETPDRLATAAGAQEQPAEVEPEPEAPAGPAEQAGESTPDWLESVAGEEIDWSTAPEEPAETPDWLADTEPDDGRAEPAFAAWDEPEVWEDEADREGFVMEERGKKQDEQPEAHDAEEEAPELDWLHQLGQPEEPTTKPGAKDTETESAEAGELPDWLQDEGELDWLSDKDMGAALELPERLAAESPAGEDLSWLDQIAGGQAEPPEEMPTLEWPDEEEQALPEEPALPAEDEAEELPSGLEAGLDWLDALAGEGDAVTAAWLDDLDGEAQGPDSAEASAEPHLFSEELDELDWLEEAAAPAGPAGEESVEEAGLDWLAAEAAAGAGLDWLAEPAPEEEAPGAAPEAAEEEAEAAAADIFAAEEEEEPLLDWLEAAPEVGEEPAGAGPEMSAEGQLPADLEEAMAWLDEMSGAAEATDAGDVPEDLEEAMAWLEQLAAQQGAPLEELPSLTAAAVAGETETQAEEVEALEEAAAFDEMPEPALPEEEAPEPNLEWMEVLAEAEEPRAEPPAPAEAEFDVPADLDEAMAWLEGLAEQEESAPGELPDWLQEEVDLGELVEDEVEAAGVVAAALADAPLPEAGDEETTGAVAEVPEDLDEALAWLEQLAAQQGAPAGELPSLQETAAPAEAPTETPAAAGEEAAPVMDITPEMETPPAMAAPDVAMMYLDSLLAGGGQLAGPAGGDQEPVQQLAGELPDDPQSALAWLEQLAGAPAEPQAESFDAGEELAGSLGWLDELEAAPEEAAVEEWAWTEELPEPEPWEEAGREVGPAAAEQAPEEMYDEIPEDPDEAMAWLERLAARQGAPLEELPFVDEVSEEVETPAWLAREMAEAEAAAGEIPQAETVSEELDWLETAESLEWLEEDIAAEEAPAGPEPPEVEESAPAGEVEALEEMGTAFDLAILEGEEMEPALPEWLAGGDESWPAELTDIDSWLVAEEEASRIGLQIPEAERPAPRAPEPAPRPEPRPTERMPAPEGTDADRLEAARAALDRGDVEAAIAAYHNYTQGGSGLHVVIADLEMATAETEQPMLLRLLGDAYMENGQLTRALEAYRRALDLL